MATLNCRVDSDEEPDDFWGFDEKEKKSKKHTISKNWLSSKNKLMETTSVGLTASYLTLTVELQFFYLPFSNGILRVYGV